MPRVVEAYLGGGAVEQADTVTVERTRAEVGST